MLLETYKKYHTVVVKKTIALYYFKEKIKKTFTSHSVIYLKNTIFALKLSSLILKFEGKRGTDNSENLLHDTMKMTRYQNVAGLCMENV